MKKDKEFAFPDGSKLKLKKVQRGALGSSFEWKDTQWTKFRQNAASGSKSYAPMMGHWNGGGRYTLVCADFDNYFVPYEDFVSLKIGLEKFLDSTALVVHSFSGKVKCFFLIEVKNIDILNNLSSSGKRNIFKEISQFVLKNTLGSFYNHADLSTPALEQTKLNNQMSDSLLGWMSNEKNVLMSVDGSLFKQSLTSDTNKVFSFLLFNDPIPNKIIEDFINGSFEYKVDYRGKREKFTRIVLGCRSLILDDGFQLPQELLGKQISVSNGTINSWIKTFKKKGWLVEHSVESEPRFSKSKKQAIRYKANGYLLEQMQIINQNYNQSLHIFPSEIKDGEFQKTKLKLVSKNNGNIDKSLTELKGIKGSNLKREQELIRASNHWNNKKHRKPTS